MSKIVAEIACIVLIVGGIAHYFYFRIGKTCTELGFPVKSWRNISFWASVFMLGTIGLLSSALILFEE